MRSDDYGEWIGSIEVAGLWPLDTVAWYSRRRLRNTSYTSRDEWERIDHDSDVRGLSSSGSLEADFKGGRRRVHRVSYFGAYTGRHPEYIVRVSNPVCEPVYLRAHAQPGAKVVYDLDRHPYGADWAPYRQRRQFIRDASIQVGRPTFTEEATGDMREPVILRYSYPIISVRDHEAMGRVLRRMREKVEAEVARSFDG